MEHQENTRENNLADTLFLSISACYSRSYYISFLSIGNCIVLFSLADECCVLTTQIDLRCDEVSCSHVCAICQLLKDIESTILYKTIENNLHAGKFEHLSKIGVVALPPDYSFPSSDCSLFSGVSSAHFLTILLLSWPYSTVQDTFGSVLAMYTSSIIDASTDLLRNEVLNLKKQLATVFNVFSCCCKS